ncbi:hypothetical protein M3196_00380 [Fictibacillus nanhaiensis]|uniref:hypothetical protein n=1 Tax=Fictibacillus nanhaiensis TaxID=742169 RepID=UPI00203B081B|nr:hypothetical protein [Fictibacillus nanhaiensis]MCM3730124.1 hypothetical protein [Fictibacillus nanhaiensis]
MGFELKQLSDVGTSNPIVARLSLQTNELTKMFPLTNEQKEQLFGLLGMKVRDRLVNCYKIHQKIMGELIRINSIQKDDIFKNNAIYTPCVNNLRYLCESFLYEAKSTLRDFIGIFDIFYEKKFKEARFDEAYKWAEKEFGKEDILSITLKQDHDGWIRRIVTMRNAVEHPGGRSGELFIKDIMLFNKDNPPYFNPPTWKIDDEEMGLVHNDMETFIYNTLGFCEDILKILLEKLPSKLPLIIYEIPEELRDPNCPIRLKVTLNIDEIPKV